MQLVLELFFFIKALEDLVSYTSYLGFCVWKKTDNLHHLNLFINLKTLIADIQM